MKKKRKKDRDKKHTNSTARIGARASWPAVSFACLKLHYAAKNKTQDTFDLRILCQEQSRDPPSEKRFSDGFKCK